MELLPRSGSLALSVCIRLRESDWKKIKDDTSTQSALSALFNHLHRFKLLCLRISPRHVNEVFMSLQRQVLSYIEHPAPQLRTFVFFNDGFEYTRDPLLKTGALFSGYAPKLECMYSQLVLHSYDSERHSSVLHNLTELSLFIPYSFSINHWDDIILDILGSSPKLEFLDLQMESGENRPVIFRHPPTRNVVLPDLQELIVEEYYTHFIKLMMGNVTFPSDTEWHFAARGVTHIDRPPNTLPQVLSEVPFTFLHFLFGPDGEEVELFLEEKRVVHDNTQTNRSTLVLRHKDELQLHFLDFWNITAMKTVNLSHITKAVFEFEDSAQFAMIIFPTLLPSLTRVESLIVRYNTPSFTRYSNPSLSFLLTLAVGIEQLCHTEYPVDSSEESAKVLWKQLFPQGGPSYDYPLPCFYLHKLVVDVPNKLTKSQREILKTCSRRRYERGYPVRIFIRYPHLDHDVLIM